MKGSVDQYKDNMAQIKETLRKEQGEGQEEKRKYDATLSDLERLKEAYHILEAEIDSLVLSNTIINGEKKDLEGKISGLETRRATTDTQAEELRARVAELEAKINSLEVHLKAANEQKFDIFPL